MNYQKSVLFRHNKLMNCSSSCSSTGRICRAMTERGEEITVECDEGLEDGSDRPQLFNAPRIQLLACVKSDRTASSDKESLSAAAKFPLT